MAAVFNVRMRDGTLLEDVASIAQNKRLKRRLNRPAECAFRVPSYLVNEVQSDGRPLICSGYRQIEVYLDSWNGGATPFFHGIIWRADDEGDEDMVYTQVTAYDPMAVWNFRPARDLVDSYSGDAGNLSDPSFIARNLTGPQIMEEILLASENWDLVPSEAEGQLFLDLDGSTYAVGGADLSGAPTNWPMSIGEIASLLTNTGELDIVLEYINGGTGSTAFTTADPVLTLQNGFQNMARVHCYNGNYGTDRTGSVSLDFATGNYNARNMRRSDSMDEIGTKKFDFLGPRLDQQHWRSNVTGDHPDLPHPPGGDVNAPYTNGAPGTGNNMLGGLIQDGREELGVFMRIGIYDNFGSEASAYPLFLRQWQVESLLRAKPREMVYLTPARDPGDGATNYVSPGDFDIGDLISVSIGSKARVVSSGAQRIYSYVIEIDDDAVESLGEIESSPDQDSI